MTTRTIQLRFFASVREAIGKDHETLTTTAATVADLRAELIARGGAYREFLSANRPVRAAVNHQMVADESSLIPPGESVEVAFFPPVTGG